MGRQLAQVSVTAPGTNVTVAPSPGPAVDVSVGSNGATTVNIPGVVSVNVG